MTTNVIVAPSFARDLKRLRKKYPRVGDDLRPFTDSLQQGMTPGNRLQGVADNTAVYKAGLPNRDAQRGKSGGYRVIYYVKTADMFYLLLIYSKSEQDDVSASEIQAAIEELEMLPKDTKSDDSP